nr:hypothetical protein [uncultured Shinella sp.]
MTALKDSHYLLADVRFEEGFEKDGDVIVATRTALHTLEIKDGRIAALHAAGSALPAGLPIIGQTAGSRCRPCATCISISTRPSTAARGGRRARARARRSWT